MRQILLNIEGDEALQAILACVKSFQEQVKVSFPKVHRRRSSNNLLFRNPAMRSQIERSLQNIREGKTVTFTPEEMEDETTFFELVRQRLELLHAKHNI